MKIAVLSDIHGNYIALEACMKVIRKEHVDAIIFLGDYLGEMAYPRRTLDILRSIAKEYTCYFVRGNKEDYWLDYAYSRTYEWRYGSSTMGSLLYTYSHLTEEDLLWFASMPHAKELEFTGLPRLAAYHGSHNAQDRKIRLRKDCLEILLEDTDASLVICGHTHIQDEVTKSGRQILNPGSVGAAIQSGAKAQFLILQGESGAWSYEFYSIKYDVEHVLRDLEEEGLYQKAPYWTIMTERMLRGEKQHHGAMLEKAMQLYHNDIGQWCWPEIPEEYFEKALAILDKNA